MTNFINERDEFLTLSIADVGAGPNMLIFEMLPQNSVAEIIISNESISFGDLSLPFDESLLFRSCYPDLAEDGHFPVDVCLAVCGDLLGAVSTEGGLDFLLFPQKEPETASGFERAFINKMVSATELVFSSNWRSGVEQLKGCGFGLTPSGDDFICGILLAIPLIEKLHGVELSSMMEEIYQIACGKNLFSNNALRLAKERRLFEDFKKFLMSFSQDDRDAQKKTASRVMEHGHSSGIDLITGFCMTLERGISPWLL